MGKYNSSATRVVPVFDALMDRDPTGADWFPYLLRVGSRARLISLPRDAGNLRDDHPRWWGAKERRLPPPRLLLRWLVENVTPEQVLAAGDREPVRTRRLQLALRDAPTLTAALAAIDSGVWKRQWYSLEGDSAPDAFLETDKIVLVVEGKRTEWSCTTKTKWMPMRSQLLRHMDAATEIAGDRQVYGLLLVEGRAPDPMTVGDFWKEQADAQVSPELLARSLPHRSSAERETLAQGVLGAATWHRVCADHAIAWPPEGVAV
jgi:hypothetical protein